MTVLKLPLGPPPPSQELNSPYPIRLSTLLSIHKPRPLYSLSGRYNEPSMRFQVTVGQG